jgi:peroxiredoxin
MAETPSKMPALGTPASDFHLPDTASGKTISLQTFAGKKALLVMFLSHHCPFVQHIKQEIARLDRDYGKRGVGMVAISANDIANYPDDAPERLKEMAEQTGFTFPFCYDESQATARAYEAACTPDFFLFDDKRRLVYRGQLDNSRPGNSNPITGRDLRAALDAVLAGKPVPTDQKPSIGCNIKWKPGNEPK